MRIKLVIEIALASIALADFACAAEKAGENQCYILSIDIAKLIKAISEHLFDAFGSGVPRRQQCRS